MEYTKDIIFNVKYNKKDKRLKNFKKILKNCYHTITKNKVISIITLASVFFIIWDIVLISNFINLLNQI